MSKKCLLHSEAFKMSQEITTIGQLMNLYYGPQMVQKDAPVLSTTSGFYNPVFGAMAFSQLNNEANVFALLPKQPWDKSGWRVVSADAGTAGYGAVAENGAIPDTIKPTITEVTATPRQVAHAFDVSFIQEGLVKKSKDDNMGDMEFLRGYFSTLHAKRINEMLLYDADTLPNDLDSSGTNYAFESIDRVTLSTSAVANLGYTTDDEDIYSIERGTNSWADAVVDENSGTDRYLTDDLIRDNLATLETAGAKTNIILTGNDTKWRIFGLYENQVRYPGVLEKNASVRIGINGVETEEGQGVGIRVALVYGIPMFTSQNVEKDTISRIYLLDTTEDPSTGIPRLFIALLYPTLYFESGMSAANPSPFAVNRFGTEGVFYTAGELICTFLAAQGSIRDLK